MINTTHWRHWLSHLCRHSLVRTAPRRRSQPFRLGMIDPLEDRALLTGTISGTVTMPMTTAANLPVIVDLDNSSTFTTGDLLTFTNTAGEYSFTNVAIGTRTVLVLVSPAGNYDLATTKASNVVVTDNAPTTVNFAIEFATGTVTGTVTEEVVGSADTRPFKSVFVFADTNIKNGRYDTGEPINLTNDQGNYMLTGVATGEQDIYVAVPETSGFTTESQMKTVTVVSQQAATADFDLLLKRFTLTGQAWRDNGKGAPTGQPLGLITVVLDANNNGQIDAGEQASVTPNTIDPAGRKFVFMDVKPGEYQLLIPPVHGDPIQPVKVTVIRGETPQELMILVPEDRPFVLNPAQLTYLAGESTLHVAQYSYFSDGPITAKSNELTELTIKIQGRGNRDKLLLEPADSALKIDSKTFQITLGNTIVGQLSSRKQTGQLRITFSTQSEGRDIQSELEQILNSITYRTPRNRGTDTVVLEVTLRRGQQIDQSTRSIRIDGRPNKR